MRSHSLLSTLSQVPCGPLSSQISCQLQYFPPQGDPIMVVSDRQALGVTTSSMQLHFRKTGSGRILCLLGSSLLRRFSWATLEVTLAQGISVISVKETGQEWIGMGLERWHR